MWDEINFPFLNFNAANIIVWEWICNSTEHFTGHVIIHPGWDKRQSMSEIWKAVKSEKLLCYNIIFSEWYVIALFNSSSDKLLVEVMVNYVMVNIYDEGERPWIMLLSNIDRNWLHLWCSKHCIDSRNKGLVPNASYKNDCIVHICHQWTFTKPMI